MPQIYKGKKSHKNAIRAEKPALPCKGLQAQSVQQDQAVLI